MENETKTSTAEEVKTTAEQHSGITLDQSEATEQSSKAENQLPKVAMKKITLPSSKELLKAGVQFGHETKRWDPRMRKYIFGSKNDIHIIDVSKTEENLQKAVGFLTEASSRGKVLFIGTKNQAADIVKEEAIKAGGFFIDARWAGGLLTNFSVVKKSLDRLNSLEKQLEEGVEGRTKYEVSRMKKEWQRLSRLYSGIKYLIDKPVAAIVVDVNFEKAAIRECRKVRIPIVALVDTNVDPDKVDYPIPANDDAINSIKLILDTLGQAVLEGNKGQGVKHNLKDYAKAEVKITKVSEEKESQEIEEVVSDDSAPAQDTVLTPSAPEKKTRSSSKSKSKGILERVKEEADKKKTTKKSSK